MVAFFLITFSGLFSLLNPIGAVPAFLSLTASYNDKWKHYLAKRACLYIFFIMIFFFFFGQILLNFFGITIDSLRVAGGVIICKSGWDLLQARNKKEKNIDEKIKTEALNKDDISFTPLAMPLLAGPGTISYLIATSLSEMNYIQYAIVFFSIAIVSLVTYFILKLSPRVISFIGHSGISSLANVMGFFVLALGIQAIYSGIKNMFLLVGAG